MKTSIEFREDLQVVILRGKMVMLIRWIHTDMIGILNSVDSTLWITDEKIKTIHNEEEVTCSTKL